MQTELCGSGPVKVKGAHGLTNIGTEGLPSVRLGKNALSERLGHKAAISLLGDFKTSSFIKTRLHFRCFVSKPWFVFHFRPVTFQALNGIDSGFKAFEGRG